MQMNRRFGPVLKGFGTGLAALTMVTFLTALPAGAQDAAAEDAAPAADTAPPEADAATSAPVAVTQPSPDEVLAIVSGRPLTRAEVQAIGAELAKQPTFAQQLQQMPPEQREVYLTNTVVTLRLLADAAVADGIDQTEAFQERMAIVRDIELRSAYVDKRVDELAAAITDAELRADYEQRVAALPVEEEAHVRHILVATAEEAQAIIEELKGGADFEALATERSTDAMSGEGGDLGFVTEPELAGSQFGPAFAEAAFALAAGAYSEAPVQTSFGWHVIKVDKKGPRPPPPFEQVSGQLRQLMLQQRFVEGIEALRDAANVQILVTAPTPPTQQAAPPEEGEEGAAPAPSETGEPAAPAEDAPPADAPAAE